MNETQTQAGVAAQPIGAQAALAGLGAAETPEPAAKSQPCLLLEQEVEGLRAELKQASQQVSAAEIASGVLHNVGNVLNSINVSVAVMGDRLRQSRMNNLLKALGLFREHQADLEHFLSQDPKGKVLPGYLETVAEHLAAEQAELVRELTQVARYAEHAREIVAMQQSYARLGGVLETIQLAELVQDAIRLNWGAFERHGISISREFAAVPPITVDRHKVLQILINLMRNAKYAMDELSPPEKRLTVSIAPKDAQHVRVSVSDNGIGIPEQNLPRIFQRGFTTRRDGHGFGLHSGLMAARDLGGRLSVASEGPGKGATFSLELPLSPALAASLTAQP